MIIQGNVLHAISIPLATPYKLSTNEETLRAQVHIFLQSPDSSRCSKCQKHIQWNLDLTKCQGTGPIGLLYRGFVILKTSL